MWHQIFPAFEVNYILMNLEYNQLKKHWYEVELLHGFALVWQLLLP